MWGRTWYDQISEITLSHGQEQRYRPVCLNCTSHGDAMPPVKHRQDRCFSDRMVLSRNAIGHDVKLQLKQFVRAVR